MLDDLSLRSPATRTLVAPLLIAAAAAGLLVGSTIAARSSPGAFAAFGAALVALVAVAAFRWPRTAIILVILSPILDRYIVADLLPETLAAASTYLSEGLLLTVSVILAARAWAAGRLVEAFRHPVTYALVAFVLVAALGAIVNGVPIGVAVLGVVFTIDAAALFFLPRLVGFSLRQVIAAVAAIGAVVTTAAVLAIGQALLAPRILGMVPYRGRHGEDARLAAFFGDPNVFGAFLVAMVPFTLLAAVNLPTRRLRWLAIGLSLVLMLALWLSFSRGAWLALILGVGVALAFIDRRAVLLGLVACIVTFAVAETMPRNLTRGERTPRPRLIDSTIDRFGEVAIGGDLRTLFILRSLPIVQDHPLVGVGPGRFGGAVAANTETPIYDEYGFARLFWNPAQRTVDNFWLHLLVETGILGAAAFVAAALHPALAALRGARAALGWRRIALGGAAAAAAGLAVSSLTTMLLEANSIGFVFWFLLGVGALVAAAVPVAQRRRTSATVPASSEGPATTPG